MNRRTLCPLALTALVLAAGAGCSDDSGSAASPGTVAGTTSAAAPSAGALPGDYCQATVELSRSTRELSTKAEIKPEEYARAADQFDQLKAIAPAEAAGDLGTIGASYRAIAKGEATIESVGPDLARASLHLAEVNRTKCLLPAPR
ncbi:hypothetical protein [Nocardia brasiliensis]